MTPFDSDAFMNSSVNEANATKLIPCPPGDYPALIKEVKTRVLDKGSIILDVAWDVDDAKAKEKTGRQALTVYQSVFLEFDDNGGLAFGEGKNVSLGRLRAAVKQNSSGQPWSPMMLKGAVAKVKVTHRVDKNTGDVRDQVSAVAAI